MNSDSLAQRIRAIPDFPVDGVTFRDITPLLRDGDALSHAVDAMVAPFSANGSAIDVVVGMEARGFIFGPLAAQRLNVGFVPLRKPGKLPHDVHQVSYDLEYGSATLEMHQDALTRGDRVLIVDDVLATGGTAEASSQLAGTSGATIVGCAFLIEIEGLGGRERLAHHVVHSVLRY